MRSRLHRAVETAADQCHFALHYERFAPNVGSGKNPSDKDEWLQAVTKTEISPDYAVAFERWQTALAATNARVQPCRAVSRVFIGHGNPSGSDVGLTVHHTWGVPVIPGSALKGILAHHIAACYGAAQRDEDQERQRWRGITWNQSRIVRGPGEWYRELFGAPDADDDSQAQKGEVIFHDALYVPGSCEHDRPFARDVLTVHQKLYYDRCGRMLPNDYDDPNPVGFINVKPGTRFLLALGGSADWTAVAMHLLLEALQERGVGAKTSLGYGRLEVCEEQTVTRQDSAPQRPAASALLLEFEAALARTREINVRDLMVGLLDEWPDRLSKLDADERRRAAMQIEKRGGKTLKKPSCAELAARVYAWTAKLRGEG